MILIALAGVTALAALIVFLSFWPELRANHIPAAEIGRAVERMEHGFGPEAASVAEQRMIRARIQRDPIGARYWQRVHRALRRREQSDRRPDTGTAPRDPIPSEITTDNWLEDWTRENL